MDGLSGVNRLGGNKSMSVGVILLFVREPCKNAGPGGGQALNSLELPERHASSIPKSGGMIMHNCQRLGPRDRLQLIPG